MKLSFCPLENNDIDTIVSSFKKIGWEKPQYIYDIYFKEQTAGIRTVIVAKGDDTFCGYVTIKWQSDYPSFSQQNIPEITDLNVLPVYQKQGIGTALINECEALVKKRGYVTIGIGVGMTADYGSAQRLYVKLGYVPDGRGLQYNRTALAYGSETKVDDDLLLFLTKSI